MGRNCKREPDIHSAAVALDGRVQETLHLSKRDDCIELALDLGVQHSKNGSIQINVLPPRQFRMKSRPDLQQAPHTSANGNPSLRRFGNPAQQFEERGFSRSIASYNPDNLALPNRKRDILKRPELFALSGSQHRYGRKTEADALLTSSRPRSLLEEWYSPPSPAVGVPACISFPDGQREWQYRT